MHVLLKLPYNDTANARAGKRPTPPATIYGWQTASGAVVEALATHPLACGASQGQLGRVHSGSLLDLREPRTPAQRSLLYVHAGRARAGRARASLGDLMTATRTDRNAQPRSQARRRSIGRSARPAASCTTSATG